MIANTHRKDSRTSQLVALPHASNARVDLGISEFQDVDDVLAGRIEGAEESVAWVAKRAAVFGAFGKFWKTERGILCKCGDRLGMASSWRAGMGLALRRRSSGIVNAEVYRKM